MKKFLVSVLMILFVFGFAFSASAVTIVTDNSGPIYTTPAIDGYATYDDDMYGMTVSITYANGYTSNLTWADLGSGVSGVQGGNVDLTLNGDTFTAAWNFDSDDFRIAQIVLDAGAGDAVFDIWGDYVGTAGSAYGRAFAPLSSTSGDYDITATYSGQVALAGYAPVGDLYRFLTIDFTDGYFLGNDFLSFQADTDSVKVSGGLSVPEPATMILLGTSLLGMAAVRRKIKK